MTLPDDYEQCGECGFDHEYESTESYDAHVARVAPMNDFPEYECLNLDGMTDDELQSVSQSPVQPECYRLYATTELIARKFRLAGNMPRAAMRTAENDRLYDSMPTALRW